MFELLSKLLGFHTYIEANIHGTRRKGNCTQNNTGGVGFYGFRIGTTP